MRPIDADALKEKAETVIETTDAFQWLIDNAPTLKYEPVIDAVWQYYTNDEGKARWRCSHCGKICHKHPYDKRRCSVCGAHMRMEE